MDVEYALMFGVRYVNVVLGFVAMWALWNAKRDRGYNWTKKMKRIWLSLFLFTYVAIQGNVELLWRHIEPTVAAYLTTLILANVIWHSTDIDTYVTDQPRYKQN